MKKVLTGIISFVMILSLTGCHEVPKLEDGKEVLVSFNDEKLNISVEDLYNKLKEEYGVNYLVEMVDTKILDKIYETNDIAKAYLDRRIETLKTYYGGEDKLLETLKNYGYQSIDDFKVSLLLTYKRELALKDYVKKNITEKEIQKYYDDEMFGDIIASHILIKVDTTSASTDDEKKEAETKALETVNEVLKKLEDGEKFADLAKKYSQDDSTKNNGGKLEAFNKGDMESEFEKAAMNLEVGKYTKTAVKTSYGYHIIYKEEQKEKASLEDVKQTIINNLVDEKIKNDSKLQYKALIELRKEYGIKINDEDLNTYYDNAVNNWLYSKDED